VNQEYLNRKQLKLQILSRGYAWLDTGTHEAMSEATEFVKAVEKRTGLKIGCLEEIAYKMRYIDREKLEEHIKAQGKSSYGEYLRKI
jgi:glucose-1-phosphate thymidylyltransferase